MAYKLPAVRSVDTTRQISMWNFRMRQLGMWVKLRVRVDLGFNLGLGIGVRIHIRVNFRVTELHNIWLCIRHQDDNTQHVGRDRVIHIRS